MQAPDAEARQERLAFARPAAVPGTEILSAWDSFRPWHVFHERYAICACRTAAAGWRYRGGDHFLNDGTVAFMEPGEVHQNTSVHKYSDFKVLFVEPDRLHGAAQELGLTSLPHFTAAQTQDPRMYAALYRFSADADAGECALAQQDSWADFVHLLLSYAERRPATARADRMAVRSVKRLLCERYDENVSLAELAAAARTSPYHLSRAFKAVVGLSPHAFQIHVRIERAMKLLRTGMPAAGVASRVGFADQSHFTRHFKRLFRITPGQYAAMR